MLTGLLGFLLSLLNEKTRNRLLPRIRSTYPLGNVKRSTATIRRLILEGFALLVKMSAGKLPTDTEIGRSLPGTTTTAVLTFVSHRISIKVIIFDDDIITLGDIALIIDSAWFERTRLEYTLVVVSGKNSGLDIAFSKTTLLQHSGTECALLRCCSSIGWRIDGHNIKLVGKVLQSIRIVHSLALHQKTQCCIATQILTAPALEYPFDGIDRKLRSMATTRTSSMITTTAAVLGKAYKVLNHLKKVFFGPFLDFLN